ncbi:aromatic amino acid exporter YddG [Futiania mangrovi]|uniref:EamA family transporter n=1 Tax=Futiania mangrovi TaxID=2959716 RepID=A0A9J6PES6_9PROT|nr:EamA family transporter [Futiania mangrovii]MCP1336336.1 EamA family transporter [Futiania mangrovii]
MSKGRATAVGFTAVLMWALLALFTAASGQVPPFQLAAMTFLVGGTIGLARMATRAEARAALRQPPVVWALGIGGLFGYHALYFTALRNAPPVEAGLIAYLWPLLIVVCSALLPGERLRVHHVAGALLGLGGAALIVTKGQSLSLDPAYATGYLAALGCAGTWTAYSLLSRRFSAVPTDTVTGFCLATSVLAAAAHLLVEETVWPDGTGEWLAVLALGLAPVGLAFYAWDFGCKHGDIQVLGASAYAAPLLSTLVLILAGYAGATWPVAGAALLISGGAALAAKDLIAGRAQPPG